MKIAVLSPRHSLPLIEETLVKSGLDSAFAFYIYDRFEDIAPLYESLREQVSGFLMTGQLPWSFLLMQAPTLPVPADYIRHSRLRPCLHLIRHQIEHPNIPLNETFCDFIHEIRDFALYCEILPQGAMPRTLSTASFTEGFVDRVAEQVLALYKRGEVKVAYLTITHLYERLQELGVPCTLIPIQPDAILEAANALLEQVSKEAVRPLNGASALLLDYGRDADGDELEYRETTVMKALVDCKRQRGGHMQLIRGGDGVEVHLGGEAEHSFDAAADLIAQLRKGCPVAFTAGVGIGPDARTARHRAVQALGYARDYAPGAVFGWDDERLCGPMLEPGCITLGRDLLLMGGASGKALGISPMNYIRLLALLRQGGPVDSAQVADFLKITVRSANRILASLLADGMLEELPAAAQGRGRPVRRYVLTNRLGNT